MIRILIVDDHPVVREGLVAVLEQHSDFTIVGQAASAEAAIERAMLVSPDIVLLDLELPGIGGVEAIPRLLQVAPSAKIIVFTAYDTDERVFGAIQAGAKGYLLKGTPAGEIISAISAVHTGASALDPRVASKVLARLTTSRAGAAIGLTAREREVLRLVSDGRSNKQIARTLGITERTVKYHVASIFNKLGADNRAQAVAVAGRRGLL